MAEAVERLLDIDESEFELIDFFGEKYGNEKALVYRGEFIWEKLLQPLGGRTWLAIDPTGQWLYSGREGFRIDRDTGALEKRAGYFDMILSTVNVALPWDAYVGALGPKGKLHLVGAAPSVEATVFPLMSPLCSE